MDEPMADLFRNMPRETVKFMRVLFAFGAVSSLGMLFSAVPAILNQMHVPMHGISPPEPVEQPVCLLEEEDLEDQPTPSNFPTINVPPNYVHHTFFHTQFSHKLLLYWLIAVTVIQLVTLPLRVRFFGRLVNLDAARLPRDRLTATMLEMVHSLEWRLNKYAGSTAYWFFIVGTCLTSYARTWAHDETFPAVANANGEQFDAIAAALHSNEVISAAMVTLVAFAARMAFSFGWFFYNFVYGIAVPAVLGRAANDEMLKEFLTFGTYQRPQEVPALEHTHTEGCEDAHPARNSVALTELPSPTSSITPPTITTADMCAHKHASDPAHPASCSICLGDFEEGVETACLPCSKLHVFHVACVVPWLRMQKRCPLCMTDIDEPRAGAATAAVAEDSPAQ